MAYFAFCLCPFNVNLILIKQIRILFIIKFVYITKPNTDVFYLKAYVLLPYKVCNSNEGETQRKFLAYQTRFDGDGSCGCKHVFAIYIYLRWVSRHSLYHYQFSIKHTHTELNSCLALRHYLQARRKDFGVPSVCIQAV